MKDVDGTVIDELEADDLELDSTTDLFAEETPVEEAQEYEEEYYESAEDDPYDGYDEEDSDEDEEGLHVNPFLLALIVIVMVVLGFLITTVIWNNKHPGTTVKDLWNRVKAYEVDTSKLLPDAGIPMYGDED